MNGGFWSRIYNFFKGYVVICVEGFFIEKFTNLCMRNNIKFWNVKKIGTSKIILSTGINDFKKMRKCANKSGCRIKIQRKKGMPFFAFKYRKRKWCLLGIILFILLINVMTSMVWSIEIKGNETINSDEIILGLNELGLKKGVFKNKINTLELSYQMMIKRDDIAFISIDTNGTKIIVNIFEKVKEPKSISKDEPCDIVAAKAGLITTINVLSGKKNVQVGDIVNEGDILVTGIMEMTNFPEKTQRVHAIAEVKAKVWYEQSEKLKKNEKIEVSQLEEFAYKIAHDKIMKKVDSNAEILKEDVKYEEDEESIMVYITIEAIEDIGREVAGS